VWKNLDTSDEEQLMRFTKLIRTVFMNLAMRVSMDRSLAIDKHVITFIEKLREIPCLFFVSVPQKIGTSVITDEQEM